MDRLKFRLGMGAALVGAVAAALAIAGCGGSAQMSGPASAAEESGGEASATTASGAESITNNQEAGVDEGGIVKAVGEHLIVLRRGRLFTVRVGADDLSPICQIDAFPPGSNLGSWYDELLVHDRNVVVVGYSYNVGATELGVFQLDRQGCISHRGTYFLRSNDYYSTRNYASRLVEGKLVFYMPHYLGTTGTDAAALLSGAPAPSLLRFERDQQSQDWQQIITSHDVHVPEEVPQNATLHTVVTCDLAAPSLSCHAHGIVGSFGRTFYVSGRNVYVWTHSAYVDQAGDLPQAAVYRLPLDGGPPAAIHAWGAPTDQFSFKEDTDGTLRVLVRNEGGGDWMGAPEHTGGEVGLVEIPAHAFSQQGIGSARWTMYQPLPTPTEPGAFQNRFVGDYVLYGNGTSWGYAAEGTRAHVYAHPYREQGETAGEPFPQNEPNQSTDLGPRARSAGPRTVALELPHGVDRIEALGRDALVVGTDGTDLHMATVALRERPYLVDGFVQANAMQGETRSHGFFFMPERGRDDGTGMLALPIRTQGAGYSHLYQGSAELVFVDVDRLRLDGLGALAAAEDAIDDRCQVSCTDWYGNARPIFYRGRIFALLGYEIVEGIVRRGQIREIARVHLIGDLRERS